MEAFLKCFHSFEIAPVIVIMKPNLSSPEATIQSFVGAINSRDLKTASGCVVNGKATISKKFAESLIDLPPISVEIGAVKIVGNDGVATAMITFGEQQFSESISLEHLTEGWKITIEDLGSSKIENEDSLLGVAAAVLANPEIFERNVLESTSLSNLSQLALAALKLAKDNSGHFILGNSSLTQDLLPYLAENSTFVSPINPRFESISKQAKEADAERKPLGFSDYTFNENLTGIPVENIKNRDEVVLFYEGLNGVLTFHPTGNALVIFADGHWKRLKSDDLKSLCWKP